MEGLSLLPIRTVLKPEKTTVPVTAYLNRPTLLGMPFAVRCTTGYEIHLGETTYEAGASSLFQLLRTNQATRAEDGAQNPNGKCLGTYVHGLFDCDEFRHAFLANARAQCHLAPPQELNFRRRARENSLHRLADTVETAVALEQIFGWLGLPLRGEAACGPPR